MTFDKMCSALTFTLFHFMQFAFVEISDHLRNLQCNEAKKAWLSTNQPPVTLWAKYLSTFCGENAGLFTTFSSATMTSVV